VLVFWSLLDEERTFAALPRMDATGQQRTFAHPGRFESFSTNRGKIPGLFQPRLAQAVDEFCHLAGGIGDVLLDPPD
jgi:hypothetical protein